MDGLNEVEAVNEEIQAFVEQEIEGVYDFNDYGLGDKYTIYFII